MLMLVLLISSLTLAAFALLFWTLVQRSRFGGCDPLDWLEDFSAATYRPMERLLSDRDTAFLAAQDGFEPAIARRLRRQRIAIFQSYVAGMIRDFHRLLRVARFIAVYSTQDQTPFASSLWRLRWSFYRSVIAVEIRVALSVAGIGTVNTRPLIAAVERLHVYAESLIPATAIE